jgi:starch phosphorylase
MLSDVPSARLNELASDKGFINRVEAARAQLHNYLNGDSWYRTLGDRAPKAIGYFSAEFGIATQLPQYSGGLGILAGDHLKAASDLGLPLVGVGLFYRAGYFRQSLSRDGWQEETYPVTDPDALPLSLLREKDGAPARVIIGLPGGKRLVAHIWVAHIGRVPLLLLDSNVEDNAPTEREVTDRLYGGGHDHRLLQEVLLGIGGVRALRIWSRLTGAPEPEVYHCNEGHAGFLGVERIRELTDKGFDFDSALEAVRSGTVFTTHTPVPAGIDRFSKDLIYRFFGGDNGADGVPVDRIIALGSEDFPDGDPAVFNMAVFGLRLGARANGVSLLHGDVSRGMFGGLWPAFDQDDVPISSVTNGVHAGTWVAPEVLNLSQGVSTDIADGWKKISETDDATFWAVKRALRQRLVDNARDRLRASWINRGASPAELDWIDGVLDPDVLTIGFARRVPSYKRLTLMLSDPERLKALLLDPKRPVQLVIAGKSHPADEGGKKLIQTLVRFTDDPAVRHRIVFLPDYDMGLASWLYPGCDVWLNNPLRPLEACGTSGMKAALNGALNLSILDGWWDEWFDGKNGWAIPTADGVMDADRRDDIEANALYNLIEKNVAAIYYDRDSKNLPVRWLELVKHTLATLGPKVLATRMVQDYVNQLYTPTAVASRQVNADNARLAKELAVWKSRVRNAWSGVAVEHIEASDLAAAPQRGDSFTINAFVTLNGLNPDEVAVQLVYGRADQNDRIADAEVLDLTAIDQYDGKRWRYNGTVTLSQAGTFGYNVRVVPKHSGLANFAELGLQSSAN